MTQAPTRSPIYDVVVIGSGAGGATIMKVLTDLGAHVALLEAGPSPRLQRAPLALPGRPPGSRRGRTGLFRRLRTLPKLLRNAFWEIPGEPYTVAPGNEFPWIRSRILGGWTNHYARVALRFADYDFQPYSRDGLGVDWPMRYEDLAPYYDKTDAFIGVTGTKEGIRSAPDGIFQPPSLPKVHDILVKKACERLGIACIPNRRAALDGGAGGNAALLRALHDGRELQPAGGLTAPATAVAFRWVAVLRRLGR